MGISPVDTSLLLKVHELSFLTVDRVSLVSDEFDTAFMTADILPLLDALDRYPFLTVDRLSLAADELLPTPDDDLESSITVEESRGTKRNRRGAL